MTSSPTSDRPSHLSLTLLTTGLCLAWLLCAFAPLWKYLSHPKAVAAMLVGLLGITVGMYWLKKLNRAQRQIRIAWFPLLFAVLVVAYAVLYPISLRHTLNHGSDREDALRICLTAVTHHQYPYDLRTFLGNKPTPLPGALWLAFPFFLLGHIAWQNSLWLGLFFIFTLRFFRYRATALFLLSIFILFSPSNLGDFTDGGDYLTNFFYVAIALSFLLWSLNRSLALCISAALFVGLTLSSRIIYAIDIIPLLVMSLQRTSRARTLLIFAFILAAAAAVTLPVFTPHPFAPLMEQLRQHSGKLRYIPAALHPELTLPLLACLVACFSFFVRMDLPRLFLVFGVSSFVMLAPIAISYAFHSEKLLFNLSYLSVSTLSFALWALSRYELNIQTAFSAKGASYTSPGQRPGFTTRQTED